jgi:UDP-glucose 4-epimerase
MPFIAQVAVGRREKLQVFGDSYDTPDGTGVRDYIHVVDLAMGHIAALSNLAPGLQVFNLGSGEGSSVLDVVNAFSHASGNRIPFDVVAPRPGDVATVVADPTAAFHSLNWRTERTLADACRDTWNWQSQNPNGFAST